MIPVVLVLSPPPSPWVGSMVLAQLKAQAAAHGHACKVIYANLLHARRLGNVVYGLGVRQVLLGELPFALALFGRGQGDLDPGEIRLVLGPSLEPLRRFAPDRSPEQIVEKLVEHAWATAEETARMVLEERPAVVGFSCTHRQLAASLLVARMVKAERPATITIFGGNGDLYGVMGTEALRRFDQIDFLARGDADISFVRWLDLAMQGRAEEPVEGIVSRINPGDMRAPMLSDEEFENLPFADHSDFLEQIHAAFPSGPPAAVLPFEMNRGCWWSMTSRRCLFCAENLADRRTRVRSDARVKAEIEAILAGRESVSLICTDTAMRKERYKELLPWLAGKRKIKRLFVETMASLDEEQVRSLARAKVAGFQPGIEHLSDDALRHLSKPTSARHNIALLKHCREYGLRPTWNYLMGIPFLEPGDLAGQRHRIAVLEHLAPPNPNPMKIQRTSRLSEKLLEMGNMPFEPDPIMKLCYPFDLPTLMNLSLTFVCPSLTPLLKSPEREKHDGQILEYLARWKSNHATSYLVMAGRNGRTTVIDTRVCRTRLRHVLLGIQSDVYAFCSSWKTRASIREALGRKGEYDGIDAAIRALLEKNLLLEIDGQFLALATRMHLGLGSAPLSLDGLASLADVPWPRFLEAGRTLGTRRSSGPKRLACYALGKLIYAGIKAKSVLAWRLVRLLSHF